MRASSYYHVSDFHGKLTHKPNLKQMGYGFDEDDNNGDLLHLNLKAAFVDHMPFSHGRLIIHRSMKQAHWII